MSKFRQSCLDTLLEEISVLDPEGWENTEGPQNWYAVCDDKGIIAYFSTEEHAFNFRLSLINARLNKL